MGAAVTHADELSRRLENAVHFLEERAGVVPPLLPARQHRVERRLAEHTVEGVVLERKGERVHLAVVQRGDEELRLVRLLVRIQDHRGRRESPGELLDELGEGLEGARVLGRDPPARLQPKVRLRARVPTLHHHEVLFGQEGSPDAPPLDVVAEGLAQLCHLLLEAHGPRPALAVQLPAPARRSFLLRALEEAKRVARVAAHRARRLGGLGFGYEGPAAWLELSLRGGEDFGLLLLLLLLQLLAKLIHVLQKLRHLVGFEDEHVPRAVDRPLSKEGRQCRHVQLQQPLRHGSDPHFRERLKESRVDLPAHLGLSPGPEPLAARVDPVHPPAEPLLVPLRHEANRHARHVRVQNRQVPVGVHFLGHATGARADHENVVLKLGELANHLTHWGVFGGVAVALEPVKLVVALLAVPPVPVARARAIFAHVPLDHGFVH
mmetsp:Transcript_14006/g.33204  ORF Transcript_14006/g.33204 Transcript_14006/m.33204 type:complete len:435 (-) Transcript_14006:235-1539(-)